MPPPPASIDAGGGCGGRGGGVHIVFWFSVRGYVRMNVLPSVQMCVHVPTYIHMYVILLDSG